MSNRMAPRQRAKRCQGGRREDMDILTSCPSAGEARGGARTFSPPSHRDPRARPSALAAINHSARTKRAPVIRVALKRGRPQQFLPDSDGRILKFQIPKRERAGGIWVPNGQMRKNRLLSLSRSPLSTTQRSTATREGEKGARDLPSGPNCVYTPSLARFF